jgi:hypothetical protein
LFVLQFHIKSGLDLSDQAGLHSLDGTVDHAGNRFAVADPVTDDGYAADAQDRDTPIVFKVEVLDKGLAWKPVK